MANVKKISIAVTDELDRSIKRAVESGEYGSSSEVVREALRNWQAKRERAEAEIAHIRQLVQAGIDSGPGAFEDISAIKKAARERL